MHLVGMLSTYRWSTLVGTARYLVPVKSTLKLVQTQLVYTSTDSISAKIKF